MDRLRYQLRFACRRLLQAPAFTLAAVLTLALGIGGTATIFALVDAVVLEALPYPQPERLILVAERTPSGWTIPVSPARYRAWQAQQPRLAALAAVRTTRLDLLADGVPRRVRGARVEAALFDLLGIAPSLGRIWTAADEAPEAAPVALVSEDFWRRALGADPGAIGRTLLLDERPATVIGVLPRNAHPPEALALDGVELWLPLGPAVAWSEARSHSLQVLARLEPGATPAQARAAWSAVSPAGGDAEFTAEVAGLAAETVGQMPRRLWLLLAAAGALLAIGCVNIAHLLLARGTARRHELALRVALGAGRGDLVLADLVESLLLAIAGGAGGLLVASWGLDLLRAVSARQLPRLAEVAIDPSVLGFCALLSLLVGVAFGLAPARAALRIHPAESLGQRGGGGRAGGRARTLLVAAEVGLALALALGAGLLAKSFWQLGRVDPGFRTAGRMALEIDLGQARYGDPDTRRAFFDQLVAAIASRADVAAAGLISELPLTGSAITTFRVAGDAGEEAEEPRAGQRTVTPGYLAAAGVALLAGRDFTAADHGDAAGVALINRRLARRFYGDRALGRTITVNRRPLEVVGVVGDVRHDRLSQPAPFEIYLPLAQAPRVAGRAAVVAYGIDGRRPEADGLRAAVAALDPRQPVAALRPLAEVVAQARTGWRLPALLLAAFALTALLLVATGVYGVMAFLVGGRRREIGIRLALGARGGQVSRGILRQGLRPVLAGIAAGALAAAGLSRLLTGLLFAVEPLDPAVFAAAALAVAAIAALACWLPARRAGNLDPARIIHDS